MLQPLAGWDDEVPTYEVTPPDALLHLRKNGREITAHHIHHHDEQVTNQNVALRHSTNSAKFAALRGNGAHPDQACGVDFLAGTAKHSTLSSPTLPRLSS